MLCTFKPCSIIASFVPKFIPQASHLSCSFINYDTAIVLMGILLILPFIVKAEIEALKHCILKKLDIKIESVPLLIALCQPSI